ncbi:lipoprotein [Acerihabitans arboris]|uniref:Lipoprotein n=1 Tax=Acerihabitans arboris TaxID=2691583 RepID=A0A845SCI2_9GAMM|nr:lipoprotein [Acerihabitans arboris]NDL62583.1 lipoprotein [Acerihabitans arboris]
MKNLILAWLRLLFSCVLASSLLSGCNNLTQYTLSEQDVNAYLQKHNDFSKNIGIPGLANAHIVVSSLASEIGRAEPDKVRLSGNARLNIDTLFGSQQADAKLTLQAQPYYDKSQGAIYLKDMRLVDYQVRPADLDTTFRALSPYLDQSLKSYFDNTPAYVLDANRNKNEAMVKKLAQGLEVRPGKLVIPFG